MPRLIQRSFTAIAILVTLPPAVVEAQRSASSNLPASEHRFDGDVLNVAQSDGELLPMPTPLKNGLVEQGRIAFLKSCTQCHEAERALDEDKDYDEWFETVREMAAKEDAEIDPNDFRAIATFLASRKPGDGGVAPESSVTDKKPGMEEKDDEGGQKKPAKFDQAQIAAGRTAFSQSCTKCHDADRSLSKNKSLAGWRATVRRMAAKQGAEINQSDFESIATYLASRSAATAEDGEAADAVEPVSPWSFNGTLSTLWRGSSDRIENPDFFVDAWLGADWQSEGPLRATVMACTSCHSDRNSGKGFTLELVEASATLDLKKFFSQKHQKRKSEAKTATKHQKCCSTSANLKIGRFVVPFGAYSAISHPGAYRTVTNPLMFNMGRRISFGGPFQPVLPAPYSDEGINFNFNLSAPCDRSYSLDLFAVNGLQGNTGGVNFNFSRSYTDNNRDPAVGGRFTLGNRRIRVGTSAMSGRMQNIGLAALDYHLWGVDTTIRIREKFRIYLEYANRREEVGGPSDSEIDGYIVEAELRVKRSVGLLARYDTLDHRIIGAGDMSTERFTWGLNFTLPSAGMLIVNHEHWMFPDSSTDVDVIGARWVTTF